MIIDVHAHYVPQKMLDALGGARDRFPNVELLHEGDDYRLCFAGNKPTRPVNAKLREAEHRHQWMRDNGIDMQVCGGWLDAFGYELPPAEGADWSRFLNEQLLDAMTSSSFLAPLGSVPLQDGELAARVLEEALDAGMAGVMIGTQPHGSHGVLDDAALTPFWEAASALGAVIYIHPMFGCGDPRLNDYDMVNAVGRGLDTTTAVARLLFAGHFDRFPDMSVILSHGGGALPFMLGRLQRNVQIHPEQYADPVEGMRKLYYDTVLFDPLALEFLATKVGGDRLMLGSDYPFPIGDHCPCAIVHDANLSESDRELVLSGTAARLFELNPA
ncbi:MAG: amidohydrolase [Gammaproteobacteria bacterium]|nr:amidohydrolase [Gammaproteobacteria bacterium]